jgi:ABC-type nickel/cobalt efflux system permease component RcnA
MLLSNDGVWSDGVSVYSYYKATAIQHNDKKKKDKQHNDKKKKDKQHNDKKKKDKQHNDKKKKDKQRSTKYTIYYTILSCMLHKSVMILLSNMHDL